MSDDDCGGDETGGSVAEGDYHHVVDGDGHAGGDCEDVEDENGYVGYDDEVVVAVAFVAALLFCS